LVGTKSGDIYDITEKTSSSQAVVNSHTEGEIWGLCAHPEKDVFVTGSDDKTVRLWDLTKKVSRLLLKSLVEIFRHLIDQKKIRLLAKLSANTMKRFLKFYLKVLINVVEFEVGVRSVCISPDGELVAAGCKNGEFAIMNISNLRTVAKKRDRKQAVQDIR
jgi:WD40 repeat protein